MISGLINIMNNMQLHPGDILLFDAGRNWGFLAPVVRWLMEHDHVAMFYGYTDKGMPLIVESIGRGVMIRTLLAYSGEKITILRPKVDYDTVLEIMIAAREIVDDPKSYYDYLCVVRFAIPRIIAQILGLPLPLKYHRTPQMICSEFVAEVFWRVGIEVLPMDIVPMPDDFLESSVLEYVGVIQ